MDNILVELKNINKVFAGNKVIDDVNLKMKKGDFVTFLGPSGCGKTTLLRTVAGFYEPDFGEVIINGKNVENLPPYKRNTPMVFQEYALFPYMTVFDNVAYGLNIQKENKAVIKERVEKVLELMQLSNLKDRYPNQMSGGQQQRVAIARALVMNPDVLLLDEPLSNLDAKLREQVRVELRLIQKKLGLTMIYVTHDQQEALAMSDMIVVINKGLIHQCGSPTDIYFRPKTKFVADFIGTTNFVEGSVKDRTGSEVQVDYEGSILNVISDEPIKINEKSVISIRPESIKLSKKNKSGTAISLKGIIKHSMFLGEKVRYLVVDEYKKEWIVDSFDSGKEILSGEVIVNIDKDKPHLIYER
ncbi:ABC transporter ATP-binding protein [Clostridium ganghwense]|uniref:Spermidine/putrescine import ATP-binding protein PotA n=1 Tax=Clostridium ganghwense TaxID=312089 RepID=A0ABT4CJR4_9CLOT|nr:ABC transporter ATP-binding protein [Clostridium ganghwense]MCY6369289.1 ABC transporter ATP-binding protein [Clostridium ganghwense]